MDAQGLPAAAFPVSAEAITEPIGLPQPVQASQPGAAENVPLFPLVMSWKVPLTGATCEYTSELSAPTSMSSMTSPSSPLGSPVGLLRPPSTEMATTLGGFMFKVVLK